MSSSQEEGMEVASLLTGFGKSKSTTEARKKAERKASRSKKERKRKKVRTAQINFRTTPELAAVLSSLSKELGVTQTEVIERGIACLKDKQLRKRRADD